MTSIDPVTLTLTGQLPLILLMAAALALPASLILLRLYRRAVLRSMGTDAPAPIPEMTAGAPGVATDPGFIGSLNRLSDLSAGTLTSHLFRAPTRAVVAYGLGGVAFAAVMAGAFLAAGGLEFLPARFGLLLWTYAWPVVLTTTLALGSRRQAMLTSLAAYFAGYAVLAGIGIIRSPAFDWTQAAGLWLVNNGPPTLLLLAFLNRRVRAVGPLVLIFMVLAVTGATGLVSLTGASESLMLLAAQAGSTLGLGATGILLGLYLLGFLVLGAVGWLVLGLARRRYEQKKMSDESITFDAIWLLFAVVDAIGLVFEGAVWILSGVVAFAGYKLVSAAALYSLLKTKKPFPQNVRLLLLRVFALGRKSERMFDILGSHWRHVGSIQLIAGPDLVTKTVEPHEFLDFLTGKLARRFIDGPQSLDRRVSEMDLAQDQDGRYRVNDFFCHENTWRLVFSRLAGQSEAVLMDLRSFSSQHAGAAYELEEVLNLVPLERAVFVIDDTTSEEFLLQTEAQAWSRLRPTSPNLNIDRKQLSFLRFTGVRSELRSLLEGLCTAAVAPVPANRRTSRDSPALEPARSGRAGGRK